MLGILNLVAIILIPIVSVIVGYSLQNREEKRKDKMHIFETLMIARGFGWTYDSVKALNMIDVVFADDKEVRKAWKDLYDKYCVDNPDEAHLKKIQQANYKLLQEMAVSLGYKNKITWETIQNPYVPQGVVNQMAAQSKSQQNYSILLDRMNNLVPEKETFSQSENNENA